MGSSPQALSRGGNMKASREYGRGATSADRGSPRFLLTRRTQGTRTAAGFAIGRGATARKLALVVAGALALTIAASSGASAATPIVNQHTSFTETFPDQVCGITGTSTVSVVDNFKLFADNTVLDTSTFRDVFTADNGKSVVIFAAGQTSGPAEPGPEGERTIHVRRHFQGPADQH